MHNRCWGSFYRQKDSNTVTAPFWEWAWTECRQFAASHLGYFIFRLVADLHLSDIGCHYWENPQRHDRCRMLRMSVIGASMIVSFASWVIYFPIGCRHPFIKYWQPLLAKTTATCSLPHPDNECQRSVNSFSCCIFGNQAIVLIIVFIKELLTALQGKNTIYQRWNTDSKLIDNASCEACKNISLVVENVIWIR